MNQRNIISGLGLSKKIQDNCINRDPIDELTKFDTREKFIKDICDKLFEVSEKEDRFNLLHLKKHIDIPENKYFTTNLPKGIKVRFNESWGSVHFDTSICIIISNFKGFNYATFYCFLHNTDLCITHCHDLYVSPVNKENGFMFDFPKTQGTSIIIAKLYQLIEKLGIDNLKRLAEILTKEHNPCSGHQGYWNSRNSKIYTYSSSFFLDWHGTPEDKKKILHNPEAPDFVCTENDKRKYFLNDVDIFKY